MNDIDILIQRYLEGSTSIEEERLLADLIDRCPDATADQRALAEILRCRAIHGEDEMEQWLTEDESSVYDRMMAHRRRRSMMRWAAAAVVIALLSFSMWLGIGGNGSEDVALIVAESSPALDCERTMCHDQITPTPSPPIQQQRKKAVSMPRKRTQPKKREDPSMAAMEGLQDAIAMIESRLDKVGDSVANSQAEQVAISDARLSRLYCDISSIPE